MKLVQINSVCGSGSTGNICVAVSELLTKQNVENYILYAIGNSDYPLGIKYMSAFEVKLQALKSRIFGNYGFQSKSATKRLIKELDRISPDVVQLHNLHSHNVHLQMLFSYLKEKGIKIYYTLHDCWTFTAYCPHYDMIGCNKWKNHQCHKCPQKSRYSCLFDRGKYLFNKKKDSLTGLNMTILTPSKWMEKQIKQSFLKDYEVRVINNGIDLTVFKPTESDFRKRYNIEDKFIILGVAFDWRIRKGLDVFIELARRLDENYRIVLVGTNEKIDKSLPSSIISIHRTQNQQELAEIYTAADVFVNPTREEVFGLVNVEANACGTPVITFNTGGSPECINEESGIVIQRDDFNELENAVRKVCKEKPFDSKACVKRAEQFDKNKKYQEYVDLYICQ